MPEFFCKVLFASFSCSFKDTQFLHCSPFFFCFCLFALALHMVFPRFLYPRYIREKKKPSRPIYQQRMDCNLVCVCARVCILGYKKLLYPYTYPPPRLSSLFYFLRKKKIKNNPALETHTPIIHPFTKS